MWPESTSSSNTFLLLQKFWLDGAWAWEQNGPLRFPQYLKPRFCYGIHLMRIEKNHTEAKITAILERVLDVFCFIIARRKLPPSSLFCSAFR